jgi:hypothetical protein
MEFTFRQIESLCASRRSAVPETRPRYDLIFSECEPIPAPFETTAPFLRLASLTGSPLPPTPDKTPNPAARRPLVSSSRFQGTHAPPSRRSQCVQPWNPKLETGRPPAYATKGSSPPPASHPCASRAPARRPRKPRLRTHPRLALAVEDAGGSLIRGRMIATRRAGSVAIPGADLHDPAVPHDADRSIADELHVDRLSCQVTTHWNQVA